MFRLRDRGIEIKNLDQLRLMRAAGVVVAQTLALLRRSVRPGITTAELDAIAEDHIRSCGAVPSFKGYADPPYPATICVSVNDEVVHGVPGDRVLAAGDVVSLDCGAVLEGWHGDAATTVGVGALAPQLHRLVGVTEASLWAGLSAVRPGGRVGDISYAVSSYVREHSRYGIVREYVGHGIGSALHQPPSVPNYGKPGRGPRLVPGMVLAVEPMLVAGDPANRVLDDEWTVVTDDGSPAAHFEHTVAITDRGAWVLTEPDGGAAQLKRLGGRYGGP